MNDVHVIEKQKATLECEVTKSSATVKWLKEGKELKSSDRIKFVSDGFVRQIVFAETMLDDESEYSCVIGDVETKATLFVDGKKEISFDLLHYFLLVVKANFI